LHGCNTNATAILSMLRLGHSKLNIDGRYNQICVNAVLLRLKFTCFLSVLPPVRHAECWSQMSLRFSLRKMCFPTLSLLLWIELNWSKYFSLDTLNCLKVRHCVCLGKRVCFWPEVHPF